MRLKEYLVKIQEQEMGKGGIMFSYKVKKKLSDEYEIENISINKIKNAESALNTHFHPMYFWLVKTYGFLDMSGNIISGLGALEQFENVVFLNNNILKLYINKLPQHNIAISYENKYNKILVLDNKSGNIYSYSYKLNDKKVIFKDLNKLLEDIL